MRMMTEMFIDRDSAIHVNYSSEEVDNAVKEVGVGVVRTTVSNVLSSSVNRRQCSV